MGLKPTGPKHLITFDSQGNMIVPGSISSTRPTMRIAIVGAPGSGKTTSCKTFPNRLWLDFDHKLPVDEISVPFWNAEFCDSLAGRTNYNAPPNQRDAFKIWLRDNHTVVPENVTLILDSWTFLLNAIDTQILLEESLLGKPNKYFRWDQILKYCVDITNWLKGLKCLLVVTMHETPERDDEGELNGKLKPVMHGSFKDQLLGHFTDAWHQVAHPYEKEAQGTKIIRTRKFGWFWELANCPSFNTNTNEELGRKIQKYNISMVPADYAEIQKIYAME